MAFANESRAAADAREYRKAIAPGGTLLCAVAPFAAKGGLSYLVSALKDLPEVRAVCVGEGPGREGLELQIEESQLEHRVALMDLAAGRTRWRALHASDLLVLPSPAAEPLGCEALAEARGWGRVIIATDAYRLRERETVRQEVVIKPADVADLVRAIREQLGGRV